VIESAGDLVNYLNKVLNDEEWADEDSNAVIEVNGQLRYIEGIRMDERTDAVVIVAGRMAVP
jgi:hypothetical protein